MSLQKFLPALLTANQQLEEKLKYAKLQLAKLSGTLKETEAAATSTHVQLGCTQQDLETVKQEMQFIERNMYT